MVPKEKKGKGKGKGKINTEAGKQSVLGKICACRVEKGKDNNNEQEAKAQAHCCTSPINCLI